MSDFYDDALPPLGWFAGPLSYPGLGPIFTATYESECESCPEGIVPGEEIRADGRGGWIHADGQCERIAIAERPTRTPGGPSFEDRLPCPLCWTYHAGECL